MTTPQSGNIAAHLPAMAADRPQTLAIVQPRGRDRFGRLRYRHFTFRELDQESDRIASGLERVGIGRGVRTVLMVPPSLEMYALAFALFKAGAVVVGVDPGMGAKNLGVCLREVEPEAFIGVPEAQLARTVFRWSRDSIRSCVTVGPRFGWRGCTLRQVREQGGRRPFPMAEPKPDETAAVLFTSGSTGVAKGVIYTHEIFNSQVDQLRRLYGIQPGEVDLPTFPLFGLFGPALGITAVLPQMDPTKPAHVDPRKIIAAIHEFGVTNLFGSPSLIQRVGRYGMIHGIRLPSLRRVVSAGAPVAASAVERFQSLLADGVQVHTPYGATEALPVCSIGSDEILGETRARTADGDGVCIGRPVERMRVRIIRISDAPVGKWENGLEAAAGEIGEIVVRGPVVTRSYFNRPASTELAKIADPDGGFWHRMGDLGYMDDKGRVWFCGRKSQRVVTPERTYYTVSCEGVFNAHKAVYRTALVGVARNGLTEPVLCVEPEKDIAVPRATLREELLALGAARPHTKAIKTILFHKNFPVDIRHNAKIFREKLAAWAGKKLS
ncbi:MAG TPA: fatty acid CoA ligase family protein [Gemmataceae bacterium]|nr:fatty acid CoA ligase family protein [Gemmataceae bacterium]